MPGKRHWRTEGKHSLRECRGGLIGSGRGAPRQAGRQRATTRAGKANNTLSINIAMDQSLPQPRSWTFGLE